MNGHTFISLQNISCLFVYLLKKSTGKVCAQMIKLKINA